MTRLPNLSIEALSVAQRQVYDEILAGPRGRVEGPLGVWLASPELASRGQALGVFCRYKTELGPRLSELAIITTGSYWQSGFEWCSHAPAAQQAGIEPAAIEAIRTGEDPAEFLKDDELAVYEFCRELLARRAVGDRVYERALHSLGHQRLVELVGVLGYYVLVCMTINVFQIASPRGGNAPFETWPDDAGV